MFILRSRIMLGAILSLLVSGLIIGLLARFAVPGKDPLPVWHTIVLGIAGSLVGGIAAGLLGVIDGDDTLTSGEATSSFLFALGGAIVLLILYRKLVQKRPLTGPGA
ncbi:MAG: GlsB/YeaQ/YmgE family stress response membrane protein [Gaiellaceae bacterium]